MRFGRKRRGAGDKQAHVTGQVAGKVPARQQACVESRHTHHDRRTREQTDDFAGVEGRKQDKRAPRHQARVRGHEKPVRVENRQGVQQAVHRSKSPFLPKDFGIRGQIAVREHRSLRTARGA